MKSVDIYVGLNDRTTLKQEFDTEKYISILKTVCTSYGVAFSFKLIEGGYIHDNGEYTKENTLMLTLIDTDSDLVEEIANDLCVFFHQESVMIIVNEVEVISHRADMDVREAAQS